MSTTTLSDEPIINISNNIESSSPKSTNYDDIGFENSNDLLSENKSSGVITSLTSLFAKINYRIVAIIFILLFLGINIFTYLGTSLDYAKNTFGPIFGNLFGSLTTDIGDLTKQTVQVGGEGIKGATDIATGTVTSGINVLQGQVNRNSDSNTSSSSSSTTNSRQNETYDQNTPTKQTDLSSELSSALAHAENSIPQADDATSSTQKSSSNKSGYCYIGEDRGFRSCIKVNENDVCMSGDIFGSEAICINPNLRE